MSAALAGEVSTSTATNGAPALASSAGPAGASDADSGRLLAPELIARLAHLDLVSRKVLAGKLKGERRSKRRGQSVEFADHRDYAPGDDIRFIDWNVFGRLDRLFVKLFEEEEDRSVYLLLDASASMAHGSPAKFLMARRICAALGYVALLRSDRVVSAAFSDAIADALPPLRGRRQVHRLLHWLERLEPAGRTDLGRACRAFALSQKRRGVLVLVSDFLDRAGHQEALRWFLARRVDVHLVHVLAREEIEPELGGEIKLVDCEDGQTTEVTISRPLLDAYRRNLDAFLAGLRAWCVQRGVGYSFATSDEPVERLVLEQFRARGLLA